MIETKDLYLLPERPSKKETIASLTSISKDGKNERATWQSSSIGSGKTSIINQFKWDLNSDGKTYETSNFLGNINAVY